MGSENILMDNFSFQRLDQACQTHFGIRAKFFENRIQNLFGGHTSILFLKIEFLCSFRLYQIFIIDVKYGYNTVFLNFNYEKEILTPYEPRNCELLYFFKH